MSAADHAFLLAYKWWLACDAYFVASLSGRSSLLDGLWVTEIGSAYQVIRTIPKGEAGTFAGLVLGSGQAGGMALEERAARLALAVEKRELGLKDEPVSAATKISWFVWPEGWTMLDRYVAKAVIGSPTGTSTGKMERFYAALAMRGWDIVLGDLRARLSEHQMPSRLAERIIDKYLFLEGSGASERQFAAILGFAEALPNDLRERIYSISESIGEVLHASKLLHRDTKSDRAALAERVEKLREFKKEIA